MPKQSRARLLPIAIITALLLAISGTGGALAGTLITSRMIKNDTIQPRDLNYVTGVEASRLGSPIVLTTKATTVLKATMSVNDAGGMAVAHAGLGFTNKSETPVHVTMRLVHVQDPGHVEVFRTTVPPLGSTSAPASILCNGLDAGYQTVQLSVVASADGVTLDRGVLTMVAGPHL